MGSFIQIFNSNSFINVYKQNSAQCILWKHNLQEGKTLKKYTNKGIRLALQSEDIWLYHHCLDLIIIYLRTFMQCMQLIE